MPQSLSFLLVHVVFSTKDRNPCLDEKIRPGLYQYMAGCVREIDCEALRVGGFNDHVHVAVRISRTVSVAKLVQIMKTASSKWLKTEFMDFKNFGWQRGYGAFTVSHTNLDALLTYIDQQEDHHRTRSFQEEYRAFLEKYNIKYNERYVWD